MRNWNEMNDKMLFVQILFHHLLFSFFPGLQNKYDYLLSLALLLLTQYPFMQYYLLAVNAKLSFHNTLYIHVFIHTHVLFKSLLILVTYMCIFGLFNKTSTNNRDFSHLLEISPPTNRFFNKETNMGSESTIHSLDFK